jgi:hypothetical protein
MERTRKAGGGLRDAHVKALDFSLIYSPVICFLLLNSTSVKETNVQLIHTYLYIHYEIPNQQSNWKWQED